MLKIVSKSSQIAPVPEIPFVLDLVILVTPFVVNHSSFLLSLFPFQGLCAHHNLQLSTSNLLLRIVSKLRMIRFLSLGLKDTSVS